MQKSMIGGSAETELTADAVMPARPLLPFVVTICTDDTTRLMAS